ncbi:MAG TPA: hypothetical protein VF867_03000 [Arthrobacter sp.]
MKKVIVLAATVLLLAGCSATASSAPSATTAASAAASSAPAADGSTAAADPAGYPAGYPALSVEDTCTKFTAILTANKPAPGSSDNQKYWATIRDALIPIRAGAAAETKTDMEGIFTFFDTRAEHWEPTVPAEAGKAADSFLTSFAATCTPYAAKK